MQSDPSLCACGCGFARPKYLPHHKTRSPLERFWQQLVCDLRTRCWLWTGTVDVAGYGVVAKGGANRGMTSVHRLSWEMTHGPILTGLFLMHTCDLLYPVGDRTYRRCVNPAHLRPGTAAENTAHMMAAGRNGQSSKKKLRFADAIEIRALAAQGIRQADLARRYNVSHKQINNIVRGHSFPPPVTS